MKNDKNQLKDFIAQRPEFDRAKLLNDAGDAAELAMELQQGQFLLMDPKEKAGNKERQKTIIAKELIKMYGVKPDSIRQKVL